MEQFDLLSSRLHWTEGATVLLIVLIVGIALRAVLAPIVTVLCAGVAFLISQRILGWLECELGLAMPNELQGVAVALMLGIVTDYSVFYFTSAREALRDGAADARGGARLDPPQHADRAHGRRRRLLRCRLADARDARLLPLVRAGHGDHRGDGPRRLGAARAGVAPVARAAALLARPAPGAAAGTRVAEEGLPSRDAEAGGASARARGLRSPRRGGHGSPQRAASRALARRGPAVEQPGRGERPGGGPGLRSRRDRAHRAAPARTPGSRTSGPRSSGSRRHSSSSRTSRASSAQRISRPAGRSAAPSRREAEPPASWSSSTAIRPRLRRSRHLEQLQRTLPSLLQRVGLGGATVGWGGETALGVETVQATDTSLWRVILVAFAVNFVFLVLFLRSVFAPLYLLVASAAALAATFGLTVYFFTSVLHDSGLPYYIPVAFSVLLLSLGSDYNIFVVGRVWKEADRRPLQDAVAAAAPRAGRAITVAGVALALSFAMLAIIPITPFAVMAFAMGVGILLDTFLVRSMLVPALVVVFGRAGRWPRTSPEYDSQDVSDPSTAPLQRQIQGRRT